MLRSSINARGFTLLEMLIAIAIFAMIGLASNAVLQTTINQNDLTQVYSDHLRDLQQGMGVIERDLSQLVARTFRGDEEHGSAVIIKDNNLLDSEGETLIFHRIGWLNPDGILPRGSIQSVAYRLFEGKLERLSFPYPDPIIDDEPNIVTLASDVVEVRYSFYYEGSWSKTVKNDALPKGIAIELEFEDNVRAMRKFLVPAGAIASSNNDDDGSNENGNNGGNNNGSGSGSGSDSGEPEEGP
ncbi:type II secretion system minor pseudopilin GspJ [Paraferrimonas haliotis]|uniref:type II secretion system minor pseudopilin GspJ n=1 Tax=Paraferrimonas haliotis TaxID=2013866 RepID=UPI000BA93878|nr:type II secretion system minor pseudopilin GspJ [Paraferrimonas haliotis]